MNGTNGNEPGYPEKALVPYPVILAATKGDPDAMKIVLQHFSGYIARLSMRKLYDERGSPLRQRNKPQRRRDAFSLPLFRSAADAAAKPF